jgi:TatD DNase family protein
LGEIGLDAIHARRTPMAVQKKVFLRQIDIAREMRLPLCIHIREATKIGMEAMKEVC